jgi:hypothetical protein
MIEQCKSFKTSDGAVHSSLEDAQFHELKIQTIPSGSSEVEIKLCEKYCKAVLDNKESILSILGKKQRKPRTLKSSSKKKPGAPANTPA